MRIEIMGWIKSFILTFMLMAIIKALWEPEKKRKREIR